VREKSEDEDLSHFRRRGRKRRKKKSSVKISTKLGGREGEKRKHNNTFEEVESVKGLR